MTRPARRSLLAWSAAFVAPLLWAMTMQAGQLLPYADCARGHRWTAVTALMATALALLSGCVCWTKRPCTQEGRFACAIGGLLALLLAFAMLLQSIAGIMLTGCER